MALSNVWRLPSRVPRSGAVLARDFLVGNRAPGGQRVSRAPGQPAGSADAPGHACAGRRNLARAGASMPAWLMLGGARCWQSGGRMVPRPQRALEGGPLGAVHGTCSLNASSEAVHHSPSLFLVANEIRCARKHHPFTGVPPFHQCSAPGPQGMAYLRRAPPAPQAPPLPSGLSLRGLCHALFLMRSHMFRSREGQGGIRGSGQRLVSSSPAHAARSGNQMHLETLNWLFRLRWRPRTQSRTYQIGKQQEARLCQPGWRFSSSP